MIISILTGFTAGAVHVVSGADHLVGVAPSSLQKPRKAIRNALSWGIGHSAGVISLSAIAILAKDLTGINWMSSFAEFSVGVVLLIVGILTIRNAVGLNIHTHNHKHGLGEQHKHFHLHLLRRKKHGRHSHALTSLGVLHGVAGASHLLAIVPALALPPLGAIAYILSYLFGSVISMLVVVLAMSLATVKAGRKNLPVFVGLTGILSVATGFFWIHKTSSFIL